VKTHKRRLVAALRAAGRLNDAEASRQDIERELAAVLDDFTARWVGKK
jgi:hypothetical protein